MSLARGDRGGGASPVRWSTATVWPPDLLLVSDLTRAALGELLDFATQMKAEPAGWAGALPGESLVSFFERPSTLARTSTEAAAQRLGLLPVRLAPDELPLADGETLDDSVRVLSSYATAIAARTFAHLTLKRLARAANVPVLNALSEEQDPCQALADLLTLRERFGGLDGLALAYVGEVGNVARSLMEAGALAAMDVRIGCPPEMGPSPEVQRAAEALAELHGGVVRVTHDPAEAVDHADAVCTGTWPSLEREPDRRRRLTRMEGYRVDTRLMARAKPTAVFLQALPAHRGEEATAAVVDGVRSAVWQEAANRLPAEEAAIYAVVCAARSEPHAA
jgi:ornithine carbamoyltransferase